MVNFQNEFILVANKILLFGDRPTARILLEVSRLEREVRRHERRAEVFALQH